MRIQFICVVLAIGLYSANSTAQWVQTNGPYGGTVQCFALSPNGAGGTNVFVGTRRGVYLSTNSGTSWTASGLTNTYVDALVHSGTTLFAGNGDGVFLSTNNGTSWTSANSGLPIDGGVTSFAVSGTTLFAGTGDGVYLSTNNGMSWTAAGLTHHGIYCLTVSGTNLFAGTNGAGIFLSSDSGMSWTAVNEGLPRASWDSKYFTGVNCFARIGQNLFAGTFNGVFVSNNNGTSWAATGLTSFDISCLTVSPAGSGRVGTSLFAGYDHLLAGGGVFLSTDSGTTWTAVDSGLANSPVRALAVSPAGGETGGTNLFAGTEMSGVFLSTNNGASWRGVNAGMTNSQVSCFVVSGTSLFAGTQGCGVFSSTNNGIGWTEANSGLPIDGRVTSFAVIGANLFTGVVSSEGTDGVYLSTNNGTSWTAVDSGLTNTYVHALAVSGTSLFAGTGGGVFLSTNSGTSWTAAGLTNHGIRCLTVSGTNLPAGQAGLFAGTNGAGIFLSTDSGISWTAVNEGLPRASWDPIYFAGVNCLARSGQNLFAGTDDAGIFLSTNNGTSWKAVNEALPKHVNDDGTTGYLVDCLTSSGQHLFAGASGDVYHSTNNGTDWTPVNWRPNGYGVRCLTVSENNLFAGMWHGSVWRRPLSEIITAVESSSEVPTTFALEQNYPNPFNPTTVIRYQLPVASAVRLVVSDILGREVSLLVDERKNAGVHEVTFDAAGLSSGVYICRLKAGCFVDTKKLMVLH